MDKEKRNQDALKSFGRNALLFLFCGLLVYGLAALEIVRRARRAYNEGENFYGQGQYRQALWSYQEVLDFYTKPESRWVDRARQRVQECESKLKGEDPVKALDELLGISSQEAGAETAETNPSEGNSQTTP